MLVLCAICQPAQFQKRACNFQISDLSPTVTVTLIRTLTQTYINPSQILQHILQIVETHKFAHNIGQIVSLETR